MAALESLRTDEEEVLASNLAFYTALRNLDLAQMEEVWLHADWVKCLHPGWELLMGWDEIRGSWENIFRSTEQMMVNVSRPLVHVAGDVAWVSCLESVTTASPSNFSSAVIEATNIFVRRGKAWRLVHHHTTPVSGDVPGASGTVQ
jgi:ketosteroid isomerase-like protein